MVYPIIPLQMGVFDQCCHTVLDFLEDDQLKQGSPLPLQLALLGFQHMDRVYL